ncbi:MAG: hypothetical protein ACLFN8_01250 [Candidatus Woesearchaeota archaeon]
MINKTYTIITEKNCEELCRKELKDKFKINSEKKEGFVDFIAKNEDALKITYYAQSAKRIIIKIGNGKFKDLEDLKNKISTNLKENQVWQEYLPESYRVTATRKGAHEFNSVIVEQEISSEIKKIIDEKKINTKADYKTKDLIFFVLIEDNNYLIGLDYAGKDLSKRHYIFFNNPTAVKGTLAFNLLMFSNYAPGKTLLDPFSLAGIIPIEAALYEKNTSIHFYQKDFNFPTKINEENLTKLKDYDTKIKDEKMNNIYSCDPSFPNLAAQKKNSRIAGVERNIAFARVDASNLDIKNFSKEIDIVATRIIEPSKNVPESKVIKTYNDLFIAANEFLSKKGTINVMIRNPEILIEIGKKHKYQEIDRLETAQGKQEFYFIKLARK